jgi:hypothetical protein
MVFTDTGRQMLANYLCGIAGAVPSCMALGSGTTSGTVNDTALEHEIGSSSNIGSIFRSNPFSSMTIGVKEAQYESVFPSIVGSNITISEMGIFTSGPSYAGSLYMRVTFTPTVKTFNEEWSLLGIIKIT